MGYITKEMLAKHLPGPGEGTLIVVCGPPPLMTAISGDKAPDKSQGAPLFARLHSLHRAHFHPHLCLSSLSLSCHLW